MLSSITRSRIYILSTTIPVAVSFSLFKHRNFVAFSSPSLDKNTSPVTLYQYKICPFCNRVKVYLDYKKIKYTTIEVNPITKSELKFSDIKKVPIALIDGRVMNESKDIIDCITENYLTEKEKSDVNFFPLDNDKWMDWSEKKLAVMLYPNITRTLSESWECFGYAMEEKSWNIPMQYTTRALGTIFMSLANGKIKKKYNIVNEREELMVILNEWTEALGKNKFLHG